MQNKLSILGLTLILSALVLSGCGPSPAKASDVEVPDDVLAARAVALASMGAQYGEQIPAADATWTAENITPALLGSMTYRFTSGDWVVTISYPVVAPDAVIYHVVVANQATGFQWEGEVNATGQVTEVSPTPLAP
jgi:hypothetical protein